ncbi:N-acetyl-gamma-glutamyl-phosphate reductase [Lentisphaerota bacterium ZTH]|nr:N-acetyl-gamma-glutamyl-phosphate reductase [Lentisphaerota bacterium ZTH]
MSIKVAVVGAAGYSGEELLRLLARHNEAEVKVITSRKYAGQPVSDVFPRFWGSDLKFTAPDVKTIAAECDAAFLALPHGLATEYAVPLLKAGVKVIDISADFRLRSTSKYQEYYGEAHPAPELLKLAVYGMPERYREQIKNADLIACPGCYPTSSILPAAPLLKGGLVSTEGIVVASMSGVTGAGRKVDLPYIFPECNESVKAYKPYGHRHLPEIEQEMAAAAGVDHEIAINFIPHLVPVNRGINSTILMNAAAGCSMEKIASAYEKAYGKEKFVRILPAGKCSDTKYVTMSNCCEIGYNYDPRTNKVILTSVIDNLTKGASGQALQCLNIMFGLEETSGLL